jgi:hypothetical protein
MAMGAALGVRNTATVIGHKAAAKLSLMYGSREVHIALKERQYQPSVSLP